MRAAQAAGDISTLLSLIATTAELTPADFIKKTVGNVLFVYYIYLKYFRVKPIDLLDLIDGLLFIEAQDYLESSVRKEAQAQARRARDRQQR